MTNGPNSKNAHERHRKRSRAIGADPHQRVAGKRGDDIFAEKARTPREAAIRLLRHFEVVVVETDDGKSRGDEQHDPHVRAF
jgi:hypothetical protein